MSGRIGREAGLTNGYFQRVRLTGADTGKFKFRMDLESGGLRFVGFAGRGKMGGSYGRPPCHVEGTAGVVVK